MALLARLDGRLSFTCVEMRDCEHPPEGRCSPQALLQHIIESAEAYGVPLAGENALQRYVGVEPILAVSPASVPSPKNLPPLDSVPLVRRSGTTTMRSNASRTALLAAVRGPVAWSRSPSSAWATSCLTTGTHFHASSSACVTNCSRDRGEVANAGINVLLSWPLPRRASLSSVTYCC